MSLRINQNIAALNSYRNPGREQRPDGRLRHRLLVTGLPAAIVCSPSTLLGQGFHYARPMAGPEMDDFLSSRTRAGRR